VGELPNVWLTFNLPWFSLPEDCLELSIGAVLEPGLIDALETLIPSLEQSDPTAPNNQES
jgi:hypothetical protein